MTRYESNGSQVGGSHDSVVQGFALMLYFYIKPIIGGVAASGDRFRIADDVLPFVGRHPSSASSADRAIDSTLRSVPLPAGLMTRLGTLVDALADESNGPADYLGC